MLPEHLNLGVYRTENGGHTVGLTADNHPLGNVFGFSENFFDRLDIIEGETDLSVLKNKLWNGNNVILMGDMTIMVTLLGQSPLFILDYQLEIPFNFMKMELQPRSLPLLQKPQLLMEM